MLGLVKIRVWRLEFELDYGFRRGRGYLRVRRKCVSMVYLNAITCDRTPLTTEPFEPRQIKKGEREARKEAVVVEK